MSWHVISFILAILSPLHISLRQKEGRKRGPNEKALAVQAYLWALIKCEGHVL